MNLTINKQATIADIQHAFHHYFPYLKIEVFSQPHELHKLSNENTHLTNETLLSSIPTLTKEGDFHFDADIKTGEFEQNIWNHFGLAVQIMRKAGHVWLQTSQTDDWSLAKQNELAKNASQPAGDNVSDYTLRDVE